MLTTTDAEILFVQTDNTLLHGETIKVTYRYMYLLLLIHQSYIDMYVYMYIHT